MNILYIDSGGVVSDNHIYQYYGDLFRELRQTENVYLYEGIVPNINNLLSSSPVSFDCIIFGLGYFSQPNPQAWQKIDGLAEIKIPTVCLLHKPQHMLEEKLRFCNINDIDILADSQSTYKEYGKKAGVKSIRSWWTATPKLFYPKDVEKKYDIGFSGALHGNGKISGDTRDLRTRIEKILKSSNSYNVFWNGTDFGISHRISSLEEYSNRINECKIWLSTTGPMLDVGPRYFEVALSNTLLFCNNMPEQYEGVFSDGENCAMFENDLSNFEEKLKYYLDHPKECGNIITKANEMVLENYTWKCMANKLLDEIREVSEQKC